MTGYATETFVNQAISSAISNLKDNTLEFPTFSDFPQPGEVGNIYIDLEEDKLYIWDSASSYYISQSWNQAIITGIQSQISAIYIELDTKLDKPTDVGLNAIPKRGDGPSGARFESSMIFQYDGKIGVGTASNPTETLDVGGRIKSDGLVLNETSSAILPKEIKFKDGKFKGAKADGIEKAFLMDGDEANNLIHTYTHNLNQEIYISSIDYTNARIIASEPHGLTIGATYSYIILVPNNWYENSSTVTVFQNLLKVFPFEWFSLVGLRVYVIDSTTLEFRNSSGAAVPCNTLSAENNGFLDHTKWHLEINSSSSDTKINFTDVVKGYYEFSFSIQGLSNRIDTSQVGFIGVNVHKSGSVVSNGSSSSRLNARDTIPFPGLVANRTHHHFHIYAKLSVRDLLNTCFYSGYNFARNSGADVFAQQSNSYTMINFRLNPQCWYNDGLAGLFFNYSVVANGTKIYIFKN